MSDAGMLLETLGEMTAVSLERVDLDARELMLVRLAALAAVDAPAASYLLNLGAAAEAGLTLEDAQSVLIATAPIIGAPRSVVAATNLADALGFALLEIEIEMAIEEALEEDEG
jgi:alkylhydroperoxidase/carboxymuconolactone decarboxylase family protein YurZ